MGSRDPGARTPSSWSSSKARICRRGSREARCPPTPGLLRQTRPTYLVARHKIVSREISRAPLSRRAPASGAPPLRSLLRARGETLNHTRIAKIHALEHGPAEAGTLRPGVRDGARRRAEPSLRTVAPPHHRTLAPHRRTVAPSHPRTLAPSHFALCAFPLRSGVPCRAE